MNISDLLPLGGYGYLASPYTKYEMGISWAAIDAAEVGAGFVRAGVPIYSPIVHSHWIACLGGINALDHDIWLPVCKPLADSASYIIVAALPGWDESYGISEELKWFRAAGKPRFLLDPITKTLEAME